MALMGELSKFENGNGGGFRLGWWTGFNKQTGPRQGKLNVYGEDMFVSTKVCTAEKAVRAFLATI